MEVSRKLLKGSANNSNLAFQPKKNHEILNLLIIGMYSLLIKYMKTLFEHQVSLPENNKNKRNCEHYIKNGYCSYENCIYNHPNRGKFIPIGLKDVEIGIKLELNIEITSLNKTTRKRKRKRKRNRKKKHGKNKRRRKH